MLMTEQEAREKFCCTGGRPSSPFCIGSSCMAWKWERKLALKDGKIGPSWGMPDPDDYEYRKTGKGYCGLLSRLE